MHMVHSAYLSFSHLTPVIFYVEGNTLRNVHLRCLQVRDAPHHSLVQLIPTTGNP
jgi:hypothetical protein